MVHEYLVVRLHKYLIVWLHDIVYGARMPSCMVHGIVYTSLAHACWPDQSRPCMPGLPPILDRRVVWARVRCHPRPRRSHAAPPEQIIGVWVGQKFCLHLWAGWVLYSLAECLKLWSSYAGTQGSQSSFYLSELAKFYTLRTGRVFFLPSLLNLLCKIGVHAIYTIKQHAISPWSREGKQQRYCMEKYEVWMQACLYKMHL